MNFIDKITTAYEERRQERSEAAEDHRLKIETRVTHALAKMGVTGGFSLNGNLVEFEAEQIRLRAVSHNYANTAWQLRGICPNCKQACWSGAVSSLAKIGEMYNSFDPEYDHRCPAAKPTTTPDDQLLKALKALVASMIE